MFSPCNGNKLIFVYTNYQLITGLASIFFAIFSVSYQVNLPSLAKAIFTLNNIVVVTNEQKNSSLPTNQTDDFTKDS